VTQILGEIPGVERVVCENAQERDAVVAISRFVQAFEKGNVKLADGAGDFEEGGDDEAALQRSLSEYSLRRGIERNPGARSPATICSLVRLFHPASKPPQNSIG